MTNSAKHQLGGTERKEQRSAELVTPRPVFVGGTGRSGTTILAKVLGRHPSCYCFPVELRFLTDPDGLISLRRALVDDWSIFYADVALRRFRRLIADLGTRYWGRYPLFGLSRIFGRKTYSDAATRFIDRLHGFRFQGAWAGNTNLLKKAIVRYGLHRTHFIGRFCGTMEFTAPWCEKEYFAAARAFVGELFESVGNRYGCTHLVEHTPSNVLHAGFLLNVAPHAKILHVYRDPRDVIASLRRRDWGPHDIGQAADVVAGVLQRWEEVRARLQAGSVLEVCFEEFIRKPQDVLSAIRGFVGLEHEFAPSGMDLSRHNIGRWRREISRAEETLIMTRPVLHRWVVG